MKFRTFHTATSPEYAVPEARHAQTEPSPPTKKYPRFSSHALPDAHAITEPYSELIAERKTEREGTGAPITLPQLSDILKYAGGINTERAKAPGSRYYPSGGAIYPLEIYVAAYRIEELSSALYHYAPHIHALEEIRTGSSTAVRSSTQAFNPDSDPAAIIVVTGVWGRIFAQYGEFSYRLALLEAGHLMQNLLLAATARHVQAAPMAGFSQVVLSRALDFHPRDDEDPLYLAYLNS